MIEGNITVGTPEAKHPTLVEVIHHLEGWQQLTSDDVATYYKELERPNNCNNNPISQSHFKELLANALHERDCLSVVIAKLEWEMSFQVQSEDERNGE